ncbi:DMT family transporter [Gemmobacter sp.]|uniref:DMT family transporter n=1 Tax=Gemmobacter sp. TaxID=1898957 RepID=UPI003919F2B9
MRLMLLTTLAMAAFAGNSLLNRWAVGAGHADAFGFAALRVASGALMLWLLVRMRGASPAWRSSRRMQAVVGLAAYMLGFSAAYLALDAGTGALILFATVQVTMFTGAALAAEPLPPRRWLGAGLALTGLAVLLWPGAGAVPAALPALAMMLAGVGWGVYSLGGQHEADPLAATAANFALCLPVVLVPLMLWPPQVDAVGLALAVASGAVTSGLGYALWFAVLPALGAGRAAVAQLGVPVLAMLGGAAILAEPPSMAAILAAAVVLGGVALGLRR